MIIVNNKKLNYVIIVFHIKIYYYSYYYNKEAMFDFIKSCYYSFYGLLHVRCSICHTDYYIKKNECNKDNTYYCSASCAQNSMNKDKS